MNLFPRNEKVLCTFSRKSANSDARAAVDTEQGGERRLLGLRSESGKSGGECRDDVIHEGRIHVLVGTPGQLSDCSRKGSAETPLAPQQL